MNRLYAIILFLTIPFMWMSCDKDVKILDDFKDITIVYGLMNPNDSISYIRIERAYLTNGDIYQSAQIADSNLYPYKLDVKIKSGNQTITFDTVTIFNKNEGIFYAPKMQVYYAVTKGKFNSDNNYDLEISNPKTGSLITSTSKFHNGSGLRFDYPNFSITFESDKVVEFKSIANARTYQLNLRFHYMEQILNDTTTRQYKYVDWVFPTYSSLTLTGGENMEVPYIGEEFYANLMNNIPPAGNLKRYYGQIELILSTADDTFNTYLEVNKPSSSLVIDRPAFTNIENGYGIYAGRSSGGGFYRMNLQTISKVKTLPDLNFVEGIPE
ncbi:MULTISPECIES: hypothetical protein [unclassified Lentimicrobium]|uniref:hypothetical protein n=1 Tax=unclassified Lentimicrobium TaxID=2677434 RepID=UPI001557846E|nr:MULTISPECIES: hypothetical protein [unclassified Lentimicrobium]NPD46436.1 hypothetical protein [Lentimicrobium sp. S6]NPD84923.1 hypothetical protein [Lentimicrobium sp. L6]